VELRLFHLRLLQGKELARSNGSIVLQLRASVCVTPWSYYGRQLKPRVSSAPHPNLVEIPPHGGRHVRILVRLCHPSGMAWTGGDDFLFHSSHMASRFHYWPDHLSAPIKNTCPRRKVRTSTTNNVRALLSLQKSFLFIILKWNKRTRLYSTRKNMHSGWESSDQVLRCRLFCSSRGLCGIPLEEDDHQENTVGSRLAVQTGHRCNSLTECRQTPTRIRLGNDHGTYPWWRSAESLIPFGGSPQVEKKEDTVGRVTVINGAMSSTLMG
jgi:hypothetical protein